MWAQVKNSRTMKRTFGHLLETFFDPRMKRHRTSGTHWVTVPDDVHEWLTIDTDSMERTSSYCWEQLSSQSLGLGNDAGPQDTPDTTSLDVWLLGLYQWGSVHNEIVQE